MSPAPTRPRLECRREPGLILRCDRKVGIQKSVRKGREENELIGSVTLLGGGVAVGDEAGSL